MTFPRGTWWVRLGFRLANVWFRLSGGIEGFVHPPARIVSAAERSGLTLVVDERAGRIWRDRRVRAFSDDGADDGVGEAVVELHGPGAELAGDRLSAALEVGRVDDSMAHADR